MNAVTVFARDGEVRASSRDVAAVFEKNHRDVLRSIDNLIGQEASLSGAQFRAAEFQQGTRKIGAQNCAPITNGQEHRCFEMTRTGFMLLVMGFTGPKALKLKLAWIAEFDRMEARLADMAANDVDEPDDVTRIDPSDWRAALQFVREARIIGGKPAARRAWDLSGLPDVFDTPTPALPAAGRLAGKTEPTEEVRRWFDQRVEHVTGVRTPTMELWGDWRSWCEAAEICPGTVVSFSKQLSGLGVPNRRSNIVYRLGVRLRP